jgi:hypothetical protein
MVETLPGIFSELFIHVMEEVAVMEYRLSSPFSQNILSTPEHSDRHDLVEHLLLLIPVVPGSNLGLDTACLD